MFEPTDRPRVFAMPPGVDFAKAFVDGLQAMASGPDGFARATVYVNTARMQRRMRAVFDAGPPCLLPQIRLLTEIADDDPDTAFRPKVTPLRRRLELSRLVAAMLDREPDLAPRSALFDLSDDLARLLDEMQSEAVTAEEVRALDVTDQSGHWQRTLRFLNIIFDFTNDGDDAALRLRKAIENIAERWKTDPPHGPIIVAGSTGSRGMTARFMEAVSRLPQGALVLPGFDFDMPDQLWVASDEALMGEDHPQFRYKALLHRLKLQRSDVQPWPGSEAPDTARNRVISLALRPAPVTARWLAEGPTLGDLQTATQNVALIEAESPRAEAEAIALRLRQAIEDGLTAALISPDRMLTRQVTAALDRWQITPDDSAGLPLIQSAPGRLLRHVAQMLTRPPTAQDLIVVLKHPLTHTGADDRGRHLLWTRELELYLRKSSEQIFSIQRVLDWAEAQSDPAAKQWAQWIVSDLAGLDLAGMRPLSEWIALVRQTAEAICAGPGGTNPSELWAQAAGAEALGLCDALTKEADAGGAATALEFAALFDAVLSGGVVRDRDAGHPQALIWGTLEARVGGADLVILGGMNEGSWPEAASADPWLNRDMRKQAGLLLPERQIGLSAHDFQQSVAAKSVVISRARRTAEAETVPSRWINRLVNLLDGLSEQSGPEALRAMRARGQVWLSRAAILSRPEASIPRAPRPSPQPPVRDRPTALSVTQIKTLIRDPYAIYARYILGLKPLDPLTPILDNRLRGIVYHKILEEFIGAKPDAADPMALDQFLTIAQTTLETWCSSAALRALWYSRLETYAPLFLRQEVRRQAAGKLGLIEGVGRLVVKGPEFTLTAKADRIDLTNDGEAIIYDYKTGTLPNKSVQQHFDKQLLLEAAMMAQGGFEKLGRRTVAGAQFLGIRDSLPVVDAPLEDNPPEQVWAEFTALITNWTDPALGYTARQAHFKRDDPSPYDHLSRFGEWDETTPPTREDVL